MKTPRTNGDGSEGEGRVRSDLRLVMRAIREGWAIDPVVKRAVIARASRVLANPDANARDVSRASNTLLSIERLALDAATQEDRMTRLDAGQATDRIELLDSISDEQIAAVARTLAAPRIAVDKKPVAPVAPPEKPCRKPRAKKR
jgi:hypothetical protein